MFEGFSEQTVTFLWNVRFQNSRQWMQENKQVYQQALLGPLRELGTEVYERMHEAFPGLPLQLHISRIWRDARRLHGRGPLKDYLWFSIFAAREARTQGPEFYFELNPESYSYGMGVWDIGSGLLSSFRSALLAQPEQFVRLAEQFEKQDVFTLGGEEYKKPRGQTLPLLTPWLQKKTLHFSHARSYDEIVFSRKIADEVTDGFKLLMPYFLYFTNLLQVEA